MTGRDGERKSDSGIRVSAEQLLAGCGGAGRGRPAAMAYKIAAETVRVAQKAETATLQMSPSMRPLRWTLRSVCWPACRPMLTLAST